MLNFLKNLPNDNIKEYWWKTSLDMMSKCGEISEIQEQCKYVVENYEAVDILLKTMLCFIDNSIVGYLQKSNYEPVDILKIFNNELYSQNLGNVSFLVYLGKMIQKGNFSEIDDIITIDKYNNIQVFNSLKSDLGIKKAELISFFTGSKTTVISNFCKSINMLEPINMVNFIKFCSL